MNPEVPELFSLKSRLSLDTRIDPCELADWLRANKHWLDAEWLVCNTSSDIDHPDHADEIYASLRLEFKRHTASRTPQSRLAPAIPTEPALPVPRSAAEPAGSFSRLFRRRAS